MTLADLFAAIDRVERGELGHFHTPSRSEYVVDPRNQTLWDLKPVFGLLLQSWGFDVLSGKADMTSDSLKAQVRKILPDLTLVSFPTDEKRRLGLRRHDADLPPVVWGEAMAHVGPTEQPAPVAQLQAGGPAYYFALTKVFLRDFGVVEAARQRAAGRCEHCKNVAPFLTGAGLPYLEVHHVIPLSQDGADRLENVLALCPNCHRKAHFGATGLG